MFARRAFWRIWLKLNHIRSRGLTWPADWSDRASPTTRLAQIIAAKCSLKIQVTNRSTTSFLFSYFTARQPQLTGGHIKFGDIILPKPTGQSLYIEWNTLWHLVRIVWSDQRHYGFFIKIFYFQKRSIFLWCLIILKSSLTYSFAYSMTLARFSFYRLLRFFNIKLCKFLFLFFSFGYFKTIHHFGICL